LKTGKPQPKKKENKLEKNLVKNPKEIEEEKVDYNGTGPQGTANNNGKWKSLKGKYLDIY
jgi:hypothetical protein